MGDYYYGYNIMPEQSHYVIVKNGRDIARADSVSEARHDIRVLLGIEAE